MMSDRDLERGPRGDHGQPGDEGREGRVGAAGERGAEGLAGLPGERGPAGDAGAIGPQGEQGKQERRLWANLRLLAFIAVAVAAIYSSSRTFDLARENRAILERTQINQARIQAEGIERRHQICLGDEREHALNVERLDNTYRYLMELSDAELEAAGRADGDLLNRFVLANLPQTEEQAANDSAPAFCDEANIGLPEPDPVVPQRPERIDRYAPEPAPASSYNGPR